MRKKTFSVEQLHEEREPPHKSPSFRHHEIR